MRDRLPKSRARSAMMMSLSGLWIDIGFQIARLSQLYSMYIALMLIHPTTESIKPLMKGLLVVFSNLVSDCSPPGDFDVDA
jgi:hypothetical protein